jgi:REP element-mobilizing transposase RayT
VSHAARAPLASRFPAHVTLRLIDGLPSLRRKPIYRVLRRAFTAGSERFGFRLVQYSVQTNHLHLLVEARDRRALVRGMQGLAIRVAKALNRLWERGGRVFADRYHDRILRTPREVRNALAYVLHNARRHGARFLGVDPFSSGAWFDGWRESGPATCHPGTPPSAAAARTWLLAVGWRRHGLLSVDEIPGPSRRRRP